MQNLIECISKNYKDGNINKSVTTELLQKVKGIQGSVSDDIAIIGMSIKAASAESIEDYWKIICDGVDCIRELPENRVTEIKTFVENIYGEERKLYKAGYLDSISGFDYNFYNITPNDARLMDPNQRLFLEVASKALEDSGYLNDDIHDSSTGVFLGYSPSINGNYQTIINMSHKEKISSSIPYNLSSITASRISYFLDLKGPSLVVDSACSSGLSAVDIAIKSLVKKDCNIAIAGGVRIHLMPVDDKDYRLGIESIDGHTRAFDGATTGSGVGEGAAAIVLKRLSDAKRDNDNIYAVIKGIALNQDGKSVGITAPNPKSQEAVIIKAWKNANIDPNTIKYIETHGTATSLGDPIEVNSITKAFRRYTDDINFCAIGSVKSNIGHLYECAGIASIIKATLVLKKKMFPKTINYSCVNDKIDFLLSPVYVNNMNRYWEKSNYPRRCGVSAFGYSGTNSHLILEEYINESSDVSLKNEKDLYVAVFSANSEFSLKKILDQYEKYYIDIKELAIDEIVWNLACCKKHYSYRLAIQATSTLDLLEKIKLICKEGINCNKEWFEYRYHKIIYSAKEIQNDGEITLAEQNNINEIINGIIQNEPYKIAIEQISVFYCKGAKIDWTDLYSDNLNNKKLSLPKYVFDKEKMWINTKPAPQLRKIGSNTISSFEEKNSGINESVKLFGKDSYTEVEIYIGETLKEVLGFKEIDVYDNFFELGLDSISMMKIVDKIRKKYNVVLDMKLFASGLNLCKLAESIFYGEKRIELYENYADREDNKYDEFELTNIQKAYMLGRNSYYTLGNTSTHMYLEYETDLDFNRLEDALNRTIEKHPMLRAVIYNDMYQKILEIVPRYKIQVDDFTNESSIKKDIHIKNLREKMSHRIFNPEVWPLFEIRGVKTKDTKYLHIDIDLLIADGISLQIILKDLIQFYNNCEKEFDEVKYTFRDYIQQYNSIKGTDDYNKSKDYWLNKIENCVYAPELPHKTSIEEITKPYFKRKKKNFGKNSLRRIKEVAKSQGVTISSILCTAYIETLRKWCVNNNFIINIASYNRYGFNENINEIVGDFTSVLLLVADYSPELCFWEKVRYIQNNILEGIANRYYDGVEVISSILSKTGEYSKALFPVVFTSVISEQDDIDMDFIGREIFGTNQTPQVYLDNQARAFNGELIMVWDFVEQALDNHLVSDMFSYHNKILEDVLKGTIEYTPRIDIFPGLEAYNDTFEEFELEPFVKTFNRQVKIHADKVAIKLNDKVLTYKELEDKTNKMANYLINQGVKKDDFVAIITERNIMTVINIIAVLKARAAYVPIDNDYPDERRNYILENSKCINVITCDTYNAKNIDELPDKLPHVNYSIKDKMYTIYTSGSTGRPKGVVLTQESVINTIIDINNKFDVSSEDKIIGISSFCFDLSVYDVFGAFMAGATLIMIEDQRDIIKLIEVVNKERITIWNSVPAIINLAVQNIDFHNDSVRVIMLSGDWIPVTLPDIVKSVFEKASVISLGGATEGAIWSIYYPIECINKQWNSIPYGMPLANQKMYVVNEMLEQCPIDVIGEICIGGLGVASEYCGDIEKTKKAFINHDELGYIYRTGDYGIFREEGFIEFLGRKDNQVKINGYRVELGEIEKCLHVVDGVKEAIVIVENNAIYGFVTIEGGIQYSMINSEISNYLPDYMIPKYIYILDEFDLTYNGKIDYSSLSRKVIEQQISIPKCNQEANGMEPVVTNDMESDILDTIRQISGNEYINLSSKLFDIGIDSILLITIITKINKKYKVSLSIDEMFKSNNIKEICTKIINARSVKEINIPKLEERGFYPTSSMQKKLFLACKENLESRIYNISTAIVVEGALDIKKCRKALDELTVRHEALRTSVKEVDGEIVQEIMPKVSNQIKEIVMPGVAIDDIIYSSQTSFSFEDESLYSFSILDNKLVKVIFFEIHHIIADGTSLHILMDDFLRLYRGDDLEVIDITFKDFVDWNESQKRRQIVLKENRYWINKLKGTLPRMELPVDYFVQKQSTFKGGVEEAELTNEVYLKLKNFGRKQGFTTFVILVSVFNILLKHYYKSDDIIIGIPFSGRTEDSLSRVVGMFVNTLPIRTYVNDNKKFIDTLSDMRENVIEGTANQNFEIGDIINKLDIKNSKIFNTIFSYQYYDILSFKIEDATFTYHNILQRYVKVPLEVSVTEFNDKIKIDIIYSEEMFIDTTIKRMCDRFIMLLEYAVDNQDDDIQQIVSIIYDNFRADLSELNFTF